MSFEQSYEPLSPSKQTDSKACEQYRMTNIYLCLSNKSIGMSVALVFSINRVCFFFLLLLRISCCCGKRLRFIANHQGYGVFTEVS